MTDYLVIYEQADDGSWSARTLDLPVYAVGSSHAEAEAEIRSALALHLEVLRDRGESPPVSNLVAGTVSV
jgi:predicted RNase H-like HicB family nuclease